MTDTAILAHVHRELVAGYPPVSGRVHQEVIDFIQTEWQKRDEQEVVDQYNRNRSPKDWIVDVREMERHRGLEIGPDGTVTEAK
tara:strand:- start:381 stop:632 length:252 start_codon:yes stop_codon:yes gene_type:complete